MTKDERDVWLAAAAAALSGAAKDYFFSEGDRTPDQYASGAAQIADALLEQYRKKQRG